MAENKVPSTDLKAIKERIKNALENNPKKKGESTPDYRMRLNNKFPSLVQSIQKLSMPQKAAVHDTKMSMSIFGATPGYPARGGNKMYGGKMKKNYAKGSVVRGANY
tara:strand:- start:119 stop:439 length:321 start_codon:yes stop_codon:yes gene_type:complete